MEKRRVGTLSMAILLIASGGMMFIAQFNKTSIMDLALKGWPLILFLLGGEILWYSYKLKDENTKIKYDLFSIFIICIIVVFNLTLYGLIQLDVVSKLNVMISSQDYTLKTPVETLPLNDDIQKIVIEGPNYCKLTIRSSNENKITGFGTVRAMADTKETAEKLLNAKNMTTHQSGNTLYISFDMSYSGNDTVYHSNVKEYTLIIPDHKKIEINNGERLELLIDTLNNDWVIDGPYDTNIRLGKNTNVKINGSVDHKEDLKGNVTWNILNKSNEESQENENNNQECIGEMIQGNGQYQIHILNTEQVTVNKL